MPDNLTLKFQRELEKRSKAQTAATTPQFNLGPAAPTGNMWDQLGQEERGAAGTGFLGELGPVKAIGAGLWQFADTWTFGLAGLADDRLLGGVLEDTMYDEESAWAKWGGAVGGLMGFMGNPMKLGFKAAGALAKPAMRWTGKTYPHMPDVAREMTKRGLSSGLSKKKTKQVIDHYEGLLAKSRMQPDIANKWKKHSTELMNEMLEKGLGQGRLSATEAGAVRDMFKGTIGRRPVKDLVDVVMRTGKFKDPKTAFVVGSMINEAVAFGLIDAVFETTRSIKEGEAYDWTAPIWGVGVGAGFGALKMLPAAGKASETFGWKKGDFIQGLKVLYSGDKARFTKYGLSDLEGLAEGHGNMLKNYGNKAFSKQAPFMKSFEEPWIVNVPYKGTLKKKVDGKIKKDMYINLSKAEQYKRFDDLGEEAAESMIRDALSKSTRNLGRELIEGSLRDEAKSMAANWHRMIGGSIIMNARTFMGMFQGIDADVHDVLPHVLIGAWVNRRGNPAGWDMTTQKMENIRGNLTALGFDIPNLQQIPDFNLNAVSSYINPMYTSPNLKGVRQELTDRQITTESTDVAFATRTNKSKGEKSVTMVDNETTRIFNVVYAYSDQLERHLRPKDDIPLKDALATVKALKVAAKKQGHTIKTEKDALDYFDQVAEGSTENIKSQWIEALGKISKYTNKFTIDADLNKTRAPEMSASTKLREIVETLPPDEAPKAIESMFNTIEKVNTILEHLRITAEIAPQNQRHERTQHKVESVEELGKLKEVVDSIEQRFSMDLPGDHKFDIIESGPHVEAMMMHNYHRKAFKETSDIFDRTHIKHDPLKDQLANVFFPSELDPNKQKMIPSAAEKHLQITDIPDGVDAGKARATLGGVLDILGAKGQYSLLPIKEKNPGDQGWEPYTSIPYSKVEGIINYLKKDMRLMTGEGNLTPFKDEIVHHIQRERIKGTSLNSADVVSLNNMAYLGHANFAFKPGQAAGWSVSKLDAIRVVEGDKLYPSVQFINQRITDLINNSKTYDKNGRETGQLIKDSGEKIQLKEAEILAWDHAMRDTAWKYDTKMMMNSILNMMSDNFGTYKEQMHSFIAKNGGTNAVKLGSWMENLGIITRDKQGDLVESEKALEMLANTKIMRTLKQRMELEGGQTYREIEEKRSSIARSVETAMSGFEDNTNISQMTASRFFTKYTVEGGPSADYESQIKYLNGLLFDSNQNVIAGGIKNLIDNVYVKVKDKPTRIGSLKGSSYDNQFQDMVPEVINLLRVRAESKEMKWLRYEDGTIREDVTKILKNPDSDFMEDAGFSQMLISGDISMLLPSMSGTMRKHLSVFEYAADGLDAYLRPALEKQYNRLLNRLEQKEVLGEDTESPMKTGGLILFRLGPDHTPFVLPKNQMNILVNEYTKMMGEMDKAIESKKLTIDPDKYTQLDNMRNVLLGGEIKSGDLVYWKDADTGLALSSHEFTVQGVNSSDMSKIKLAVDPNVDVSTFIDKTHREALKKAVSEGVPRENLELVSGDRKPDNQEYIWAMKRWNSYKWLVGETNDWSVLQKYYESPDNNKLLSRYRLFQTKNFGREQRHLFKGMSLTDRQSALMKKYKKDFNIAVYDDAANHDVKVMMEKQLQKFNLKWADILGDRKSDSGIDSIAYVTKDMMEYLSFTHGFKNWKTQTVLKPVISSNKDAILFGKTIFVFDPAMKGLFEKSKTADGRPLDVLLTGTASKILGSDWNIVSKKLTPKEMVGKNFIRKLPLDVIGVKSEDYQELDLAKKSLSNYNYMTAAEGKEVYTRDYKQPLERAMMGISKMMTDHVYLNQFLKKSYPDEDSIESMMGNESNATMKLAHMRLYNDSSNRANPMDISPRQVYNRLYKHFISPIINAKSILWGDQGYLNKSEGRYGGKAIMIQSLDSKWQDMRGTIVDNEGRIRQIGEIGLPHADREVRLDALHKARYEMRFVNEETQQIVEAKEVFGKKFWDESLENGWRLGDVHDFLQEANRANRQKVRPDYIVAHSKGDNKWVFIEGSESYNKAIKDRIILLDKRGKHKLSKYRGRGTEYKKKIYDEAIGEEVPKKMYDVLLDMVEHQKLKNPVDGSKIDIWIAESEDEARAQFENIKSTDGKNFMSIEGLDPTSDAFGVAIMSNRYPRTRPNDVTYLKLKDFLDKEAGNAVILNPYDVLNVFEGDYDADRSDYYFMQNKTTADHVVKKMGEHWIQGIEPESPDFGTTKLTAASLDAYAEHDMYEKGIANTLIHSKARGISQTMPRVLTHIEHLSIKVGPNMVAGKNADAFLSQVNDTFPIDGKQLVVDRGEGVDRSIIVMDYNDKNVQHRLALNSQTMLDAAVAETGMFNNVGKWKRETFFGKLGDTLKETSTFDDFKPGFEFSNKESMKKAGRPRIFRKFSEKDGMIQEEFLNVVEQEMLMEVMNNHSKFLQIMPGVFEKSGERKNPSYEEVWQITDDYFSFFEKIGKNLYNKLKFNRNIRASDDGLSILNSMFGAAKVPKRKQEWKYVYIGKDAKGRAQYDLSREAIKQEKKIRDKDFVWSSSYDPWSGKDNFKRLFKSMHKGESGHVVDRIFHRIWQNNIFEDKPIDIRLTGADRAEMDDHLRHYMWGNPHDTVEQREKALGEYVDNVKNTVTQINKKIASIPKLKRQWAKIDRKRLDIDFTSEKKETMKEGINDAIRVVENDIGKFFDKKYWKQRAGKDVGDGIRYRDLHHDKDLREGAIQYYTLRALADIDWNSTYGAKNKEMNDHLRTLKSLERVFYSDWAGNVAEKTTFKYGPWMTLLGEQSRKYLEKFPERATFEDVRDEILTEGANKFGWGYLYRYAQPVLDKLTVGVFYNMPVPVPFKSSSRYKTMLGWLAKKSSEHDSGGHNHAQLTLTRLANTSDRWRNLLEDRSEMIPSKHQRWEEFSTLLGLSDNIYHDIGWKNLQMPSLHKDFVRQYKKYSNIRFDINRRHNTDPVMLTNNHVINFYRDLFKASKLSEDFETYLDKMSAITALEIEGRLIDPMMYAATLQNIEGDILPKLNRVLSDGELSLAENTIEAQRLRNNPLWSALGGSKFVLGKKMSFEPIKRLSKKELETVQMFIQQGRNIKEKTREAQKQDEIVKSWSGECEPGDIIE